ncbi:hypothetical protein [Saccharicrinis sp. FJH54]|uniref:hypothetical protein n=1 Tax=Saccharicrinis sp. FJH54 TaxID=3344665 RepID=UPI0035D40901
MKRTIFIIFVLFLNSTIYLYAQNDFRPGYVLKHSGDTLQGRIDYRGDFLMGSICTFKGSDHVVRKFMPEDIIGFRFHNGKYFVSRKVGNKKVFLEYLIKGKVDVYYLRDKTGDHYFLDKEGIGLSELKFDEGIEMINNKKVWHKSTIHIGYLKYYMQDAPQIEPRILSVEKPEHQSLIKLAEAYHNAVCDDEKCIVYETKIPVLKISVAPFAGVTKYGGSEGISPEYGSYFYFSLPRANDKLSVKTGITGSRINTETQTIGIVKIPLQLQYLYPSEHVQPMASAGYNLVSLDYENYHDLQHTMGLNLGVKFNINKTIGLYTTVNTEFTPFGFTILNEDIKFKLIAYSAVFGLHFNL